MPVSPEIRSVLGHDDEVIGGGWDREFAPGADVRLPGGVRLNGCHHLLVHAESTPEQRPENDGERHDEGGHDHGDIEG